MWEGRGKGRCGSDVFEGFFVFVLFFPPQSCVRCHCVFVGGNDLQPTEKRSYWPSANPPLRLLVQLCHACPGMCIACVFAITTISRLF